MKLKKKIVQKNKKIEDYFSTPSTSFASLWREKEKWKELYKEKAAILAIFLAIVSTCLLISAYRTSDFAEFESMIKNIVGIIIASLVTLLGFIISGLAISTGTITNKLVNSVNKEEKAGALMGILFSFYFIGMIIGVAVVTYVFTYFFLYSKVEMNEVVIMALGMLLSYLFLYCIFYSISLLGTCIRLFIIGYMYGKQEE